MPKIILKPNRDEAVRRFHPWVFSGAIARIQGKPQDGDIVEVLDSQQHFLAMGHYHEGSIAVKIFSFESVIADIDFWYKKLQKAWQVRKQVLNLSSGEDSKSSKTNSFRLIHGEGDGMPGLIIDYYAGVAVVQAHSIGMYRSLDTIVEALLKLSLDVPLVAVYNKSHETLPEQFAQTMQNGYLWGQCTVPHAVSENGHTFLIDWETGQKTGFFLDQRDNRYLLTTPFRFIFS